MRALISFVVVFMATASSVQAVVPTKPLLQMAADACMGNTTLALAEVKDLYPAAKMASSACKNTTSDLYHVTRPRCTKEVTNVFTIASKAAQRAANAVGACADKKENTECQQRITRMGRALSDASSKVYTAIEACQKKQRFAEFDMEKCITDVEALSKEAKAIHESFESAKMFCKMEGGSAVASSSFYFILCVQKCDSSSPWTMHGLWPQTPNNWPSYCTNEPFSQAKIQDLWGQITTYWETCPQDGSTEQEFLGHEWTKHGTCASSQLGWSQHHYFSTALSTFQQGQWQSECNRQFTEWGSNECKVPYYNLN